MLMPLNSNRDLLDAAQVLLRYWNTFPSIDPGDVHEYVGIKACTCPSHGFMLVWINCDWKVVGAAWHINSICLTDSALVVCCTQVDLQATLTT